MSQQSTKMGFVKAEDRATIIPRLIMSVMGLEKQGKTHFALTAPGPIAMFSTDIGEEGVVGKFTGGKKIEIYEVARRDESEDQESVGKEWDNFKAAYLWSMRAKEFRTVLIDTATEIWELLRLARFGTLTQVMPYQYGPVNKEYRMLIREAYNWDKNLILLHKMKAQYINDKKTGEYERAGFNDTGFLVQVNAQVWRYDPSEGGEFVITVNDARQNPEVAGVDFEGPMCDWEFVQSAILEG